MRVVVTGASRGIGRGIALALGNHGYQLGLLARSEALLAEVAKEVRQRGGQAVFFPCDVSDPDAVDAAFRRLAEQLGGLDGLVNNAGVVTRKSVLDISREEWRQQVDVNLNGLFYCTKSALPFLTRQESSHIINISSISGRMPLPGGSGYAATKFGVTGFSRSIFQELRGHGVKVTVVYPGSVGTGSDRHDDAADHSWKVEPEEVGEACHDILKTSAGTVVSELEIRPLSRPPR
jgi:3-oxoacyl-[acyl-carrier protein] reductase